MALRPFIHIPTKNSVGRCFADGRSNAKTINRPNRRPVKRRSTVPMPSPASKKSKFSSPRIFGFAIGASSQSINGAPLSDHIAHPISYSIVFLFLVDIKMNAPYRHVESMKKNITCVRRRAPWQGEVAQAACTWKCVVPPRLQHPLRLAGPFFLTSRQAARQV